MGKKTKLIGLLCLLSTTVSAIDLLDPRVRFVNDFPRPASMTAPLGDIEFSADGNTVWFIDAAATADASVWAMNVERATNGSVTGFSNPTQVFTDAEADTGLSIGPGTDTFVYRTADLGVTQRFSDGSFEDHIISEYGNANGGLAFVPNQFSNGGSIVSSSCDSNEIYLHTVSDDGDGSFTVGTSTLYADLQSLGSLSVCVGDVAFVTEGALAPALVFIVYGSLGSLGDVFAYELDATTGEPIDGPLTEPFPLAGSIDNGENWGVAVDPISGNLFVIDKEASNPEIFQFSLDGIFLDRFEPSP